MCKTIQTRTAGDAYDIPLWMHNFDRFALHEKLHCHERRAGIRSWLIVWPRCERLVFAPGRSSHLVFAARFFFFRVRSTIIGQRRLMIQFLFPSKEGRFRDVVFLTESVTCSWQPLKCLNRNETFSVEIKGRSLRSLMAAWAVVWLGDRIITTKIERREAASIDRRR